MEDVTVLAEEAVEVAKSGKNGLKILAVAGVVTAVGALTFWAVKRFKGKKADEAISAEHAEGTNQE